MILPDVAPAAPYLPQADSDPRDLYIGRRPLKPRFWLRFLLETFGRRRVCMLVAARMRSELLASVTGLEHLPQHGAFILAVNHFAGRAALDTAAAVLHAVGRARPDSVEAMTVVVGQRRVAPKSRVRRAFVAMGRRILDRIFARWRDHVVRIPLRNPDPNLTGLRAWRDRGQPAFVFPEGRARVEFGAIRRGAGRWLASIGQPIVPVGVWWREGQGWTVRFGVPLTWTHRADLYDVQLGLEMASLLPEALAFDWRADLARWRAAHESR